jgi:hypothetical protein
VTAAPGPQYKAGGVHRFFFGSTWRDLWTTPFTVPVLNLDTFAGGLTPEREGGNKQSVTLHMKDARGGRWVFRSIDKYPAEKLSEGKLEGTPLGNMIQDGISSLHPTGQFVMPPLLNALGVLNVAAVAYVLPDDERLGKFRKTFAGMMGALEVKPNDDGKQPAEFGGATKVADTKDMMEDIEKSAAHSVAQRELLRSRLLDFIVGDTDRTTDNYRFAQFPHPEGGGRQVWRPMPRDRDWVFIKPDGFLYDVASKRVLPKWVQFGPKHASLNALTFSTHVVDRNLLTALDRAAFEQEIANVQSRLTDVVIEDAVKRLPPTYPPEHARWLADAIKARRNTLSGIGHEFYAWLASEVDVQGSDDPELAEIEKRADGSVSVTISTRGPATVVSSQNGNDSSEDARSARARAPHYQRVFVPAETREVRVFLHDGDDVAVVRGTSNAITVRVIGGGDNDVLADSSAAGGVHLYDSKGENRFIRAQHTRVNTGEWTPPAPPEGMRQGLDWAPDWGGGMGWNMVADHGVASGFVFGAGPTWKDYGFRRLPYHWKVDARVLYGVRAKAPGAELLTDYRFENSPHSIETLTRWSGYDGFRWFGVGNDTERLSEAQSVVEMKRFSFEPAYVFRFGNWRQPEVDSTALANRAASEKGQRASLSIGPVLRHTSTEGVPDGPFFEEQPLGFQSLWQAGVAARFEWKYTDGLKVPRRGIRARAIVSGYPGMLDLPGAYGTARADLYGYVPLIGNGPHLALRVGGMRAIGDDVPAFDMAYAGGRSTLRGFSSRRFTGDASAYGSAELRLPLFDMMLIVPGELGAFALTDAGRVWADGESPDGWHTSYGGGLWFEAYQRSVSFAYTVGEAKKFYVWVGVPF